MINAKGEEKYEDPEGLDDPAVEGWGDYPLDAIFVRTEPRSVAEVVKRISNDRYILDPDFQRDFVWNNHKQSKLIESCIMRIPLPVFYVAEASDGKIIVVDGLQRLTTFTRFLNNELKLIGLQKNSDAPGEPHPINQKYFKDLSINLQERVQDTQLTMYILDAKAPERARLDIFERVNSGEPLTRQQMRNALYNGPATNWLRDAAKSHAFKVATGNSLNPKTMRDREAINRYCAFSLLGHAEYTGGDMDAFLARSLKVLGKLDEKNRARLSEKFADSMNLNRELFGEHAFRKSLRFSSPGAARTPVNISLFEVCGLTFSRLPLGLDMQAKLQIKKRVIDLLHEKDFDRAITYSTNSTSAVRDRFEAMQNIVSEFCP